jgi:general secretion pathway protein D
MTMEARAGLPASAGVLARPVGLTPELSRRPGLLALLALALTAWCAAAQAQDTQPAPATRPADEFVYRIPPEGIPLEQLAKDAEVATGRTFIISDKSPIKGKTIRFSGEARVPNDQILSLFQSLFVTQGYALKPLGEATSRILVVESIDTAVDLKQRATFIGPGEIDAYRNEVGTVVMTFFPLRYVRLQNVRAALSQILTSKSVEVTLDVESANALIVIGFAPTVYALKQIIAVMDVPQPEADLRFDLLGLKHAVAEEIEPIILELIEASPTGGQERGRGGVAQGGPGTDQPAPRVIADPRLNALAVYAVETDMNEIRRLVAALDSEFAEPSRNIHIFWLRHTNAEDVADVLAETYGFSRSGGSGGGRPPNAGEGRPGAAGDRGAAGRSTGSPSGGSRGGSGARDDVLIIPEPTNNALVIRASGSAWAEVKSLIETLDRARPQVIIQGAVAELTDSQFKSIGVELTALAGGEGFRPGALTGFGLSTVQITQTGPIGGTGPGTGTGTGGGMGGGSISQPGDPNLTRIPFFPGDSPDTGGGIFGLFNDSLNVPILISLLQNGGRGNLVSTPLLVANDNGQSMIEASRQIATVSFQSTPTGDESSFGGYQEAKISLTISPHVSNDDYVRLEVELLVEAFVGTALSPSVPPDKTSRRLVGSVTMPDGATAVVGGLILDANLCDMNGVPPFADAPIIGPFFSLRNRRAERTSLYFFLSPTIVSRFETLDHVSYQKKLEVQKLQGPIRLIDPDFRPILLDDRWIGIEGIEASGNLDLPRFAATVPLVECNRSDGPARDAPDGFR